jgi:tight adherence protein B
MPFPLDITAGIAAVAAASSFGLVAFALVAGAERRRARRRFVAVRDQARGIAPTAAVAVARSLARQGSGTPKIDRVAGWLPRRQILAARLSRTGRQVSIGQYAIACAALMIVASAALIGLTRIGVVPSLLIGLAIGTAVPHMMIGRLAKRRTAAFIALFPEAIDLMVRALQAGLPITEAIVGAGREIADPVGAELRQVESGMRMGRDLEPLLWEIAARIEAPEFRFFITALSVQRETGGNLAETLANLSEVLRRRRQMRAKVRAMASETRATTMILGGLPVAVILLLAATSPGYLKPLFTDVRGLLLDGLALSMLGIGIFIMTKMAHFEI